MYVYSSCMILSHISISKYFAFFQSSKIPSQFFLFQSGSADRTGRPEPVSRKCTLVHVCRSSDRSTARKHLLSVFLTVARPVDRPKLLLSVYFGRSISRPPSQNCVSFFEAGRPVSRPEPNGYMPAGRTDDRTGRPSSLQRPNGSFHFGDFLKNCF